ncbi:hypothetical protein DAEQUDRAFT_21612 [Daedalea quercina L-15889]|uniref:Uncharacterized protein n=1 Tax=Daedalea quercina L-15889 TaxID=1314783 RepID=A0A165ULR2_9APHY|nr:hypothetical protein DAEQUDRAFT_21612 [Daedalea quercina L-15889]
MIGGNKVSAGLLNHLLSGAQWSERYLRLVVSIPSCLNGELCTFESRQSALISAIQQWPSVDKGTENIPIAVAMSSQSQGRGLRYFNPSHGSQLWSLLYCYPYTSLMSHVNQAARTDARNFPPQTVQYIATAWLYKIRTLEGDYRTRAARIAKRLLPWPADQNLDSL